MMKKLLVIIGTSLVALMLVVGARADGGGGGGGNERDSKELKEARTLIKKEDYAAAVPLLETVIAEEPKSADAHNWMGYAQRNLGNYELSKAHYEQALQIDPKHRGALEYYGELHLKMDNLAAAEDLLERLDKTCWFGCEEFDELEEAINAYKAKQ